MKSIVFTGAILILASCKIAFAQTEDPLRGTWQCYVEEIRAIETLERDSSGKPILRDVYHEDNPGVFSNVSFFASFSSQNRCELYLDPLR